MLWLLAAVLLLAGGSASAQTTWDPTNHSSDISVGGPQNLGAVINNGAAPNSWKSGLANTSHTTGKYCWEAHVTTQLSYTFIGFGNASTNFASYLGSDANSFGAAPVFGWRGVSVAAATTWGASAIVQTCVDLGASLIWQRTDTAPNWNANALADPATGLGGGTYTTAGPLFPAWSGVDGSGGEGMYINAGGWPFLLPLPSGFSAWDSTAYTAGLISGTHGPTTWNASDKSAGTTLSGGNLTALNAASTSSGARTGSKWTAGLVYFEATIGPNLVSDYVGIDDGTTSMTAPVTPAAANLVFLGFRTDGAVEFDGTDIFTWGSATSANHVIGIAEDLGRGMFWVKDITAGGNWNNNASSTPVGEILPGPLASIASTAYTIWSGQNPNASTGDSVILNAGCQALVGTLPTGFSKWDATGCGAGSSGANIIQGFP